MAALSQEHANAQNLACPSMPIESKFLIGLTFRLMLRDIIFSSQRRNNQNILQHPIRNLRRLPVYQEILQYFLSRLFRENWWSRIIGAGMDSTAESLERAVICATYEPSLRRPTPTSASSSIR